VSPRSPTLRALPSPGSPGPGPAFEDSPLEGGLLYAVRWFAAIRLGFMAVAIVTPVAHGADDTGYDAVCALGTAYALALVAFALWRPEPLLHWHRLGLLDLAFVSMLVFTSGGSGSSLVFAYFAIPFLVAFVARPGQTALWSLATIASFIAVSRPRTASGWGEIALLGFTAIGAVAFSAVLVRLHRLVIEHARRESALAAAIVRVEEREGRRLADALHDGVAQHIADARRELSSRPVDDAVLARAVAALDRALAQLRGKIFDLYPHVLDHAGLEGAVSERARQAAERGGFDIAVEVDPAAVGLDDVTVMAVLRELLENVVKHANATHVDVWVAYPGGSCLYVGVHDDGRGFDPPSPEEAARAHHFGLHSTSDRLSAIGGSLDILSVPGSGARASARIPLRRAA